MKSRLVFGSLAFAGLVACGGDDGGGGGIKVPDAGGGGQVDAPPMATCYAAADYGSPMPGAMEQAAIRYCATNQLVKCPTTATMGTMGTATDPFMVVYVARLNMMNDFFSFEMWKGAAPFTMKIGPASNISLSDPVQSQWKTCGACAYVSAQVDTMSGMDKGTYLASAGTANVTTVTLVNDQTMTKLTGSVSAVDMTHVDIDTMTFMSTPSADGCKTKMGGLNFDLAIKDPAMMVTSDPLMVVANRIAQQRFAKLFQ